MAADNFAASGPAAQLVQLADLATPFAVRTAVTLGVPDQIAAGISEIGQLADAVGADASALARLLRFLVHKGVFAEPFPGLFKLTDVGYLLCDRSAGGYGSALDLDGFGARMDLAFAGLPHAIRTGEPGYESVHGRGLWADLDAQPAYRAYFDDVMRSQQKVTAPQVAALYPWSDVGHVADIAGGSGALLHELLRSHPHLRGTLVDRPAPVATATQTLAGSGVEERLQAVVGDFFEPLPAGADVYVLSRALTDWSDEHATTILRRCADAAGADGRVLVVEVLPTEPHVPHLAPYDLQMLVLVGGRERGVADHVALASAAGLALARTFQGDAGLTLLEFVAAGPGHDPAPEPNPNA